MFVVAAPQPTLYQSVMLTHDEMLAELLRKLDSGDLRSKQVSDVLGIPSSRVAEMRRGRRRIQPQEMSVVAKMLGIDNDGALLPSGPTLFIKGNVQAGYFAEAWEMPEDEWERYTGRADVSAPVSRRFGLRVVGDSMNEVYPPGTILDCIAFDPFNDGPIQNGKRVIVRRKQFNDGVETTVKEYLRDDDGIEWLVPRSRNPAFQAPFRCDQPGDGIEHIEIIGIVVASIQPE